MQDRQDFENSRELPANDIPGLVPVREPGWMAQVLRLAGVYDIVWSLYVLVWPAALFHWSGMAAPRYPELWRGLALFIGVGGIGYLIASHAPFRHWPIVVIGFLGKILGVLGFLDGVLRGHLTWKFGATVITNDVIWLIPFGIILGRAYANRLASLRVTSPAVQSLAFRARTNKGQTLLEISRKQPTLLVFLRYRGCPFCRQALRDISAVRREIERRGCQIVFVHMEEDQPVHEFLTKYGLSDLARISDPNRTLYRAFGLRRGTLWDLIGPQIWWQGIRTMVIERYGAGWLTSDPFQMSGVFAIHRGHILRSFIHQLPSDRPNYLKYVPKPVEQASGI